MKLIVLFLSTVLGLDSYAVTSSQFKKLRPFLGEYYAQKYGSSCKSFEVFIKKDASWETLVGFRDAFDVGFDPRLNLINKGGYVSDAGGNADRTTTFTLTSDSYSVVDKFSSFTHQFTLKMTVAAGDILMKKYSVKVTGVNGFGKQPFECEYTHFVIGN